MHTKHFAWNDATKELTIFCRETGEAFWCTDSLSSFMIAKGCADSFQKLYEQGVRHGKKTALEEMRRTIAHVERNI